MCFDRSRVWSVLTFWRESWTSSTLHGQIPRSHDRIYGWCTGSYQPQAFGITTGRIGMSIGPNTRLVPISPTAVVFFRNILEAKGKFSAKGKYPGNEYLLWHGTARACRLGEPGQNVFCTSPNCSLCSIARGSFNMACANAGAWQRFGSGIYTSTKSSK